MDLESLIILLTMIFLCGIPIVVMNSKKKIKEKLFLKSLFTLAEENHSKISEFDKMDRIAIGIDNVNCKLFYINRTADKLSEFVVDLKEVEKCRIINLSRTVSGDHVSQTVIEKIGLELRFYDQKRSELNLELYNSNYDSLALRGEPEIAGKWSQMVNLKIG